MPFSERSSKPRLLYQFDQVSTSTPSLHISRETMIVNAVLHFIAVHDGLECHE